MASPLQVCRQNRTRESRDACCASFSTSQIWSRRNNAWFISVLSCVAKISCAFGVPLRAWNNSINARVSSGCMLQSSSSITKILPSPRLSNQRPVRARRRWVPFDSAPSKSKSTGLSCRPHDAPPGRGTGGRRRRTVSDLQGLPGEAPRARKRRRIVLLDADVFDSHVGIFQPIERPRWSFASLSSLLVLFLLYAKHGVFVRQVARPEVCQRSP